MAAVKHNGTEGRGLGLHLNDRPGLGRIRAAHAGTRLTRHDCTQSYPARQAPRGDTDGSASTKNWLASFALAAAKRALGAAKRALGAVQRADVRHVDGQRPVPTTVA